MSAEWQGDCGDVVAALTTQLVAAAEFASRVNGMTYGAYGRKYFGSDPASYTATARGSA